MTHSKGKTMYKTKSILIGTCAILSSIAQSKPCYTANELRPVTNDSKLQILNSNRSLNIFIDNEVKELSFESISNYLSSINPQLSQIVESSGQVGVSIHEEACTINITDFSSFIVTTPIDVIYSGPPNADGT